MFGRLAAQSLFAGRRDSAADPRSGGIPRALDKPAPRLFRNGRSAIAFRQGPFLTSDRPGDATIHADVLPGDVPATIGSQK